MIISVEGNIGSGKSTVLAALAAGGVDVFEEPVGEWKLLTKFYEDMHKYALAFSLEVLSSFFRVNDVPAEGVRVTERSPLTGRDVFSRLLVNDGVMTRHEWEIFKRYSDVLGWTPDAIVYIQTPAAVCLERMARRGRAGEVGAVDAEYLERLEKAHDTMLRFAGVPVVRVDGAKDPESLALDVRAAVDALAAGVGREAGV